MEDLRSRTCRIVIIDDDDAGRDSLEFALRVDGYRTEAWTSNSIPDGSFLNIVSCIVVEQALENTSGMSFLLALRRQGLAGPAILTAFEPGPQVRNAAAPAGITILERPFLIADLIHCIEALTKSSGRT